MNGASKTFAKLLTMTIVATGLCSSAVADEGGYAGVTNAAPPGGLLEALLFYAVATSTVVAAIAVCFTRNIVRMAVWLLVTLGSVALLYFLLAANFLGAIQLIVYAGGTLILLLFGVMLTSKSPWARYEIGRLEFFLAGIVSLGLLGALCGVILNTPWPGELQEVAGQGGSWRGRDVLFLIWGSGVRIPPGAPQPSRGTVFQCSATHKMIHRV